MSTTPPGMDRLDDDPREAVEFLIGQVTPLLRSIRCASDDDDLVRLLAAQRRLQDWLGELMFAHVAAGGSVRIE